eukprot:13609148-Alexandrium_andersonii.AAC.1
MTAHTCKTVVDSGSRSSRSRASDLIAARIDGLTACCSKQNPLSAKILATSTWARLLSHADQIKSTTRRTGRTCPLTL